MFNKKVTLSADETTATVVDATLTDIFSTAISMNSGVTGLYGMMQGATLFGGGVIAGNKIHSGAFFDFGPRKVGVSV